VKGLLHAAIEKVGEVRIFFRCGQFEWLLADRPLPLTLQGLFKVCGGEQDNKVWSETVHGEKDPGWTWRSKQFETHSKGMGAIIACEGPHETKIEKKTHVVVTVRWVGEKRSTV